MHIYRVCMYHLRPNVLEGLSLRRPVLEEGDARARRGDALALFLHHELLPLNRNSLPFRRGASRVSHSQVATNHV